MRPSAVVFDVGGVLIDWNPAYLYRKMLPSEVAVSTFLENICTMSWNEQFDAGRPFADGIADLVEAYPQHANLIEAYWSRWNEMLGGEIRGTAALLGRLKLSGVPVHAISNFSAETFPRAQEIFPFLGSFDVLVVSGHVRLIKPHAPIFEHFLERAGVRAVDCLFIDDNEDNVRAAASLGFQTEHFRSADILERRLIELGLLATSEGAVL